MFFVPVAFMDALSGMVGIAEKMKAESFTVTSLTAMEIAAVLPLSLLMFFLFFWGQACVLTVAKRLVSSPAGRNRTSFKAVRKQAFKFVGPLFLLEVLRTIITLLWALLLFFPGVIYSIRTIFYDIMLIEGGKVAYGRPVLDKSADFVRGRTGSVFWIVLQMALCVFIPVALIDTTIMTVFTVADSRLETLALVLTDGVDAFAGVFFIVCIVALYANLKKNPTPSST